MHRQQHDAGSAPAPITLSASLYCDRHLDSLLREVVGPFRDELPSGSLWFMRYSRGGQHIKVRVLTADETSWPGIKARLADRAERFFATLPAPEGERISNLKLPPLDDEDKLDGEHPDRSILWTRFRPSPFTVGNERFVTDARLLRRFYECMCVNSGLVLDEIADSEGELALKTRQSRLLQTAVACLYALDLSAEQRLDYLVFHRDWLLRYLLSISPPQTTAHETIDRLDQKLDQMEATVSGLSSILSGQAGRDDKPEGDGFDELRGAARDFFDHVRQFRGLPEYDLDPYTTDAAFLPLFKVLHGFANPINVPVINELYTYQLLLRAAVRTTPAGSVAPVEA